jgi:hypothetical protein
MLRPALILFALSVVAEVLELITFTPTGAAAQRDPE